MRPDLATFGKAIANGYPLGPIGGRAEIMDLFNAPDPEQRVLIAGTYNGHPSPVAAAIATMEKLLRRTRTPSIPGSNRSAPHGSRADETCSATSTSRQPWSGKDPRSALTSWTTLRATGTTSPEHHDMARDLTYRRALIERGIYHFPLPTKQGSISAARTPRRTSTGTVQMTSEVLKGKV